MRIINKKSQVLHKIIKKNYAIHKENAFAAEDELCERYEMIMIISFNILI